ncbi:CBS domain-containing protein [Tabrizicola piscis]|uniref:CBS domain-containing protein n=2 Tax=Tabrizicola piscis TaxID=2494374 RepID=A0A3S8UBI2_9RHOB|nr:CBS domain-containing protein [Tabrizicola piscis]
MAGWRAYGPAMAGPKGIDLARAGIGAMTGLLLAGLALRGLSLGWLIAPFGASAVLVFAVPNSPLAQPWSVVVGNGVSALVALAVVAVLPAAPWVMPVAVGLAIIAMLALRALHPPGGAVALLVALGTTEGWAVTLGSVVLGSAVLMLAGVLWNRAAGRAYPFRQPDGPGPHGTTDPTPQARIGVDPAGLQAILEDYRQSANLGVADLARLVGAVEEAAAARRLEGISAADIMSRDLVTVGLDTPLAEVAELFRSHGFTSLPVVDGDRLAGVIFQIDVIRRADTMTAAEMMQTDVPLVRAETPVGALLPILSDGGTEAVPVVQDDRLVGIVTRTDLVSALARRLAGG